MYWIKNSSVFALVKHYMYFLQLLIFCQTENAYDFFLIICEGIFLWYGVRYSVRAVT